MRFNACCLRISTYFQLRGMGRKQAKALALTVAAGLLSLLLSTAEELRPEKRFAGIATAVSRELPAKHLSGRQLDDEIAGRVLENYLRSLDEFHIYFLESDIADFESKQDSLDDRLKEGDVAFAYDVFAILKKRVANRCAYVEELLKGDIDIAKEEGFAWKRKYSPWPASNEAWDDTWRKIVKNQYVQRLVTNAMTDEEAGEEGESKQDSSGDDETSESEIKDSIAERYNRYLGLLKKWDSETILELYLSSFALAYDPHCQYMSPSTVDNFDVAMKLSLVGIGAILRPDEGAALVVRLVPGGPAASDTREIRLREGDKIIGVAQGDEPPVDTLHWPLHRVVQNIRGKKGTKVVLTVMPASDTTGGTTKKVDLIRDEVKLEDQGAKHEIRDIKMADDEEISLGLITLPSFYGDMQAAMDGIEDATSATRDVAGSLQELKQKNVKGVLVDLRNNGGGALREAATLTGLFVENGPVVQIVSRDGITVLPDTDPAIVYTGPLVILVNRNSASASEIFAGALQDYGRAVVVGDSKTLGKGSVQVIRPLSDDKKIGSLRVTTALYYRILGSSTQLKGVSADIILSSPLDRLEVGEDYLRNPLEWSMVRPLGFAPFSDLADALIVLGDNSGDRCAENERYGAYIELLDQVESMDRMEELPLSLDSRIELERKRKEVREAAFGEAHSEDENKDSDIVLAEALNILADLTEVFPDVEVSEEAIRLGDSFGAAKQDASEELREEILLLVKQLGDSDAAVRSRAKRRLKEIGHKAVPFLKDYKKSEDPELREVIRELLGE